MNGTPLPHEEPQELNPPAGVVAYYWLKTAAAQPLKLELVDGRRRRARLRRQRYAGASGGYRNPQRAGHLGAARAAAFGGSRHASLNLGAAAGRGGGGGGRGGGARLLPMPVRRQLPLPPTTRPQPGAAAVVVEVVEAAVAVEAEAPAACKPAHTPFA